jgi:hypothetical protein
VQKLEAQKVEYYAIENKFSQLKRKQQPYDSTLAVVNKSLDKVLIIYFYIDYNTVLFNNLRQFIFWFYAYQIIYYLMVNDS